jgi:hypothetical protein
MEWIVSNWYILVVATLGVAMYFCWKRRVKIRMPKWGRRRLITQATPAPANQPAKKGFWEIVWNWLAVVGSILGAALVTLIVVTLVNWCNRPAEKEPEPIIKKDSALMVVDTTPCSPTFDYKFRLVTDGPVWEKFPGIPDPVYFDGIHDNPVRNRLAGPVKIWSADPKKKHIRIQIWKILY